MPKSLQNSVIKKSITKQGSGFEKIEETELDDFDSVNEPDSSKNAGHCLVMTSVENASIMYKYAGTVLSSKQSR